MTRAISLRQLIAGSTYFHELTRNAAGVLKSTDELMRTGVTESLRAHHNGIYAFLAFHPIVNAGFTEYVLSGAPASDSTKAVLVLFLAPDEYRRPAIIIAEELHREVHLDQTKWGAHDLVQHAIPADRRQPLPGVLIFDADVTRECTVYVPYVGTESVTEVSRFCQKLFAVSEKCFLGTDLSRDRFDEFCLALAADRIAYVRATQISFQEWILNAYRRVLTSRQDIAAIIRTAAKLLG